MYGYARASIHSYQMSNAHKNMIEGIGFIAVHPEKGIFLGVDENRSPVFSPIQSIEAEQQIPAFFDPETVTHSACKDQIIFECELVKVDNVDLDNQVVTAKNIIEDGQIKNVDKGLMPSRMEIHSDRFSRAFHSAAHFLRDPIGMGHTKFKPTIAKP